MENTKFVHLHLHTDYSLLDGACEVETVMNRMVELKMPAAAITDHGNLFGAVSFYETAKKKGIKPIIGCEVYVARGSHTERTSVEGEKANHHLVLLCENNTGYKNLVKLVSHGYLQGFYYKPRVDKELLAKHSEGLICLSACLSGEVCSNLVHEQYEALAARPATISTSSAATGSTSRSRTRDSRWSIASIHSSFVLSKELGCADGRHQRLPLRARRKTRGRMRCCCASRRARR